MSTDTPDPVAAPPDPGIQSPEPQATPEPSDPSLAPGAVEEVTDDLQDAFN